VLKKRSGVRVADGVGDGSFTAPVLSSSKVDISCGVGVEFSSVLIEDSETIPWPSKG